MDLSCLLIPNEEYVYEMRYEYVAKNPEDYEYIESNGVMLGKKLKKLAETASDFYIKDKDTTWVIYTERRRPDAFEFITINVHLCNFAGEFKLLKH